MMSDDRPTDAEPRRTQQADDEAARHFQHLTGMSAEAARQWVAFSAGRNAVRPPRPS
jgi:hypothetical protein